MRPDPEKRPLSAGPEGQLDYVWMEELMEPPLAVGADPIDVSSG